MEGLTNLQRELHRWCDRNFPNNNEDGTEQFLGVVEEVGELSHEILKGKQRIRGYQKKDPREDETKDAIGDITIYLMNYCSYRGWDFEEILRETASVITKRDWVAYPQNGESK